MMAAEEESLKGGWFERIIAFYEVWLRRALEHPVWLGGLCLVLIAGSYFCFNALGSDLLPAMDEGGFILDYVMPAGSSLQETNRVITHVENIIKTFPIPATSRSS
jgi:multidrug efflux pump subunit AcrB